MNPFLDPRASPEHWAQAYPGFSWAPITYELLAQEFVNNYNPLDGFQAAPQIMEDFEMVENKKVKTEKTDNNNERRDTLHH